MSEHHDEAMHEDIPVMGDLFLLVSVVLCWPFEGLWGFIDLSHFCDL